MALGDPEDAAGREGRSKHARAAAGLGTLAVPLAGPEAARHGQGANRRGQDVGSERHGARPREVTPKMRPAARGGRSTRAADR